MDDQSTSREPIIGEEVVKPHDPYGALRHRNYLLYAVGNITSVIGGQALDVAIGWELYQRTGSALALGYVGLVEVIPVFLFMLPAGHVADRFDRRGVVIVTQALLVLCALALAALSVTGAPVPWFFAVLFGIGTANSFRGPARSALLPQIVPPELFDNAVTWNSTGFQLAAVTGPALGGLLIAVQKGASGTYVVSAMLALVFIITTAMLRGRQPARKREPATVKSIAAGLRFVFDTRLILACITLDMFAVLLGGATTLLPIYQVRILHVGPSGLGWLRAAPAIGASLMALTLAHRPPMRRAGRALLWAVTGFGAATIVFGISKHFWLSIGALVALGALDNISVVIRETLIQLRTPDALRGRVSAVNSLFVGTSNELGGFESGLVAHVFGPVFSVVAGGIGTVLVVGAVALLAPQLRALGALGETVTE